SHGADNSAGDNAAWARFPFVRGRGPRALIGLSRAVPSAAFRAGGRLGREQIALLAEALERQREFFRVVLIHHPPISKPARHLKRLVDGAEFRAVLARHGAELVIHGHDHGHSLIELEGPPRPSPVVGAPSASGAAAPPAERDCAGYNLYRIEGGRAGWRCEAIWRGAARDSDGIVEIKRIALSP